MPRSPRVSQFTYETPKRTNDGRRPRPRVDAFREMNMELGISSWSIPWSIGVRGYPQPERPIDAIGLLDKAVQHDVRVVQIADNMPLTELGDVELDQLSREAADRGLVLEVGTRGLEPEHLVRYITVAYRLGARALRTVLAGSLLGAEHLAGAESAIRRLLRDLERHEVRLALENNEAFSAAQYSELMERIAHPLVGMCIDTANSLGRPELLETTVSRLSRYAVMLHAKDFDIQRVDTRMGFSIVGRPAGAGRVDFDLVLRHLRDAGLEDISVIVEHWPPFAGTIGATMLLEEEWLATSVEYLRAKLRHCATK
jgi:3-oxoisoapionate decarboxylase